MARNYIDPEVQEYLSQDLGLNVSLPGDDDEYVVPGVSVVLNTAPITFKTADGREGVLYENGAVEMINE